MTSIRLDLGVDAAQRVASALSERFGLGVVQSSMTPSGVGLAGAVWELRTDRGRWAAKGSFESADAEAVEAELMLQERAIDAGIRLPRPVRGVDGSAVQTVEGHDWRVYEWAGDARPARYPVVAAEGRAVGAVAARLHALALPPHGAVSPWLSCPPEDADWEGLLATATRRGLPWARDLGTVLPELAPLTEMARAAEDLPTVLCHCDLTPDNVRFLPDGSPLVLDWERTGPLAPARELGIVLVQWAVGAGRRADVEVAREVAGGYREAGGVVPQAPPELFAAAVCAWLNLLYAASDSALDEGDEERRRFGMDTIGPLLDRALSRAALRALAEAVDAG